ncbi:hypothetical protein B0H19DRAFT_1368883 [Mycena capillaripes]|nr:hypothetical protein B0H19DRAFT_1368883 [Mycena capillaripes]
MAPRPTEYTFLLVSEIFFLIGATLNFLARKTLGTGIFRFLSSVRRKRRINSFSSATISRRRVDFLVDASFHVTLTKTNRRPPFVYSRSCFLPRQSCRISSSTIPLPPSPPPTTPLESAPLTPSKPALALGQQRGSVPPSTDVPGSLVGSRSATVIVAPARFLNLDERPLLIPPVFRHKEGQMFFDSVRGEVFLGNPYPIVFPKDAFSVPGEDPDVLLPDVEAAHGDYAEVEPMDEKEDLAASAPIPVVPQLPAAAAALPRPLQHIFLEDDITGLSEWNAACIAARPDLSEHAPGAVKFSEATGSSVAETSAAVVSSASAIVAAPAAPALPQDGPTDDEAVVAEAEDVKPTREKGKAREIVPRLTLTSASPVLDSSVVAQGENPFLLCVPVPWWGPQSDSSGLSEASTSAWAGEDGQNSKSMRQGTCNAEDQTGAEDLGEAWTWS